MSQLPLLDSCDICGAENVVTVEVDEEFICPECQIDEFTGGLSVRVRAIIHNIENFTTAFPGTALNIVLRYGAPDGPEGWLGFMEREWFYK